MSKIIKAKVLNSRYSGQIVRVSNISSDELGKQNAACILPDGTRANLKLSDLEIIPEAPIAQDIKQPKTSMPFVSGATSSRTMTHTKNMQRPRIQIKPKIEENDEEE